jgi:hypothetical protein
MANAYGILANNNPGASLTTLYTAAASTEMVGTLFVANRAATTKSARVALSPLGAVIDDDHYIIYDVVIPANDSIILNGLSLQATDVIRVYSTDNNVSFVLTGVEIT